MVESISGRPFTYQPQSSTSSTSTSKPGPSPSSRSSAARVTPSRRGGATSSRRAFQGKLTQEALEVGFNPQVRENSKTPTTSQRPSGASSQVLEGASSSRNLQSASGDDSQQHLEEDQDEKDPEEQKRNEAEIRLDLERLRLLDRLDEVEEQRRRLLENRFSQGQPSEASSSSSASSSSNGVSSSNNAETLSSSSGDDQEQVRSPTLSNRSYSTSSSGAEANRDFNEISSSSSSLVYDDYDQESVATSETDSLPSGYSSDESLAFLQTVFPNSSKTSLKIALEACDGDVPLALDLLTAQQLAEEEEIALERERNNAHITQDGINGLTWAEIDFHSGEFTKGNGLNDLLLENGTRSLPSSPSLGNTSLGWSEAGLKGKKGRNARRKAREEEQAAKNGTLTSGNGKDSSKTIINLTDVRHGAPIKNKNVPVSRLSSSTSSSSTSLTGLEHSFSSMNPAMTQSMSDEELARRLNEEERARNGDAPVDSPVTDNSWLLTSSILSQLSTLLDLPASNITSVYNLSSFNLAITFSRLLTHSSDQYALEDLDKAASAPSGTASGLVKGISALTGTSQKETEKAFRATKGRQDSTIDLLQLWKTVVESADPKTLPDELDPLGRLRDDGARKANANALVPTPNATSVDVGGNVGRFSSVGNGFPSLNGSSSSPSTPSLTYGPSQYGRAALRNASNNSSASPAALALASGASSVSLPLSSSRVSNPSDSELLSMSSTDINSLQLSYAECRAKEESYRLKANSYRQSAGQAYRKAKGGSSSANGLGAGGIAWYYANEVTRMDNMRYEWGKRAALALVRDRQRSSTSNPSQFGSYSASSNGNGSSRNVVDLHGLTKQESISVIEKCLNSWWSQPSHGGTVQPFSIITGAGRHSRGGISILKPAIKKWLDHNGWKIARDTDEGVLRVVGVK